MGLLGMFGGSDGPSLGSGGEDLEAMLMLHKAVGAHAERVAYEMRTAPDFCLEAMPDEMAEQFSEVFIGMGMNRVAVELRPTIDDYRSFLEKADLPESVEVGQVAREAFRGAIEFASLRVARDRGPEAGREYLVERLRHSELDDISEAFKSDWPWDDELSL